MIDEGSTDGTVERLEQAGVAVVRAPEPHGLTQSWNMVRLTGLTKVWVLVIGLTLHGACTRLLNGPACTTRSELMRLAVPARRRTTGGCEATTRTCSSSTTTCWCPAASSACSCAPCAEEARHGACAKQSPPWLTLPATSGRHAVSIGHAFGRVDPAGSSGAAPAVRPEHDLLCAGPDCDLVAPLSTVTYL